MDAQQGDPQLDQDEFYRQLCDFHPRLTSATELRLNIFFNAHRFYCILLMILILSSPSDSLPIATASPINANPIGRFSFIPLSSTVSPPFGVTIKATDRLSNPLRSSVASGKTYRHYSVPVQQSFRKPSNVQPTSYNGNVIYPSAPEIYSKTMEEQMKRERQRRLMIDRMVNVFDEDGDGQLTRDELYSMALRSNMFSKIHVYLKSTNN